MTPSSAPQSPVPEDPDSPGTASQVGPASTEFMILPDGTIYARNLTPELAAILATLNPQDATMALRASAATIPSVP